ncbi:MAG: flagellar biosynthesis protein FlhF [Armatimonadetes bacterium]|nr:flagellar biosynthesis protein FlhF [Armatimonadota bacterium]
MKIKRFEAESAPAALRLARAALGDEAVVLQTRRVRVGGLLRLGGRERVEVLAAVDSSPVPAEDGDHPRSGSHSLEGYSSPAMPPAERGGWERDLSGLREELAVLRRLVLSAACPEPGEGAPADLRAQLRERGLSDAVLARLWEDGPPADLGAARARLANQLPAAPIALRPSGPTVVALVGPTGVGKTTTVAKLAASAALVEGRRVLVVTLDTYRIGAVEQLQTYARLINVPLVVAASATEVSTIRPRFAEYDLVLLDTVGRSPRCADQIAEQARALAAAEPTEVHLLLAASASIAALHHAGAGFAVTRPTHLLLTKRDEAVEFGPTVSALVEAGLPVSYVTTGQNVPQDIEAADPAALAAAVLGEEA